METKEVKKLVLVRVPPGDCWTPEISLDVVPMTHTEIDPLTGKERKVPLLDRREVCENKGHKIIDSLTGALEFLFIESNGRDKEFHLSAMDGRIYQVTEIEVEPEPEPEPQSLSLYGEY